MIAISAALALGPAMDAARSPERRVKVKLTTRTVRHTKAASASLRKINDCIVDNYDGERVTASSQWYTTGVAPLNLPVSSAYACDMLMICPSLWQRAPPSLSASGSDAAEGEEVGHRCL